MTRLQKFKDTLADANEHLKMALDCIDDALCDLDDASIGIKSDKDELAHIKADIGNSWNEITKLQQLASY